MYNQFTRRYSDEEFINAVNSSFTFSECAKRLGYEIPNGGTYITIRKSAKRLSINISHLTKGRRKQYPKYADYLREWKKSRIIETEGTKHCNGCFEVKKLIDFYIHRGGKYGRNNICKICSNLQCHLVNIKRLYGLNYKEYEEMYSKGCNICGTLDDYLHGEKRRLSVDHCHETGKVRGILCNKCNWIIGQVKDNPILLRKAANYLERQN